MTEITVRPMERTEADLAAFQACFEANGVSKELEHLRWQFFDAPGGQLLVDLAEGTDPEGGERILAGIYAVFSIRADVGGRTVHAVQSIDTLTDHRFRGQGLFKRLAASVYERVEAEGNELVYGFPNGNSAHGFFERLGWTNLDPLPIIARPLRTGSLLKWAGAEALSAVDLPLPVRRHRLRGRALEFVDITRFDHRYDALWQRFSARIPVAIHRGSEYLNWRLVDKPGVTYRRLAALHHGELAGFVVWRETEKYGGGVGYLLECLCEPDRPWIARALLATALRRMRDAGMGIVQGWSMPGSPLHGAWLAEGFLPLPQRFWSTELHVGARGFTPSAERLVTDRSGWYLSLSDSDTV